MKKIGVLGAGTMGAGIAQVAAGWLRSCDEGKKRIFY